MISDLALGRVVALTAFLWTYVGLTLGRVPGLRVDRTGIAIIGAAAMVVTGVIPWDAAVDSVDTHTLVLLFGMMIVSAYLRLSGFPVHYPLMIRVLPRRRAADGGDPGARLAAPRLRACLAGGSGASGADPIGPPPDDGGRRVRPPRR